MNASHSSHFLNLNPLTETDLRRLLTRALGFFDQHGKVQTRHWLKDQQGLLMFFENSTRTALSFEKALTSLGATVAHFDHGHSSLSKGESLLDTFETLEALQFDCIIMRHSEEGALESILEARPDFKPSLINAGDGKGEHPSQALLDLLTIKRAHGDDFSQRKVAIVGDIVHSRVANSLINGLAKLGTPSVHLVGPPDFLPQNPAFNLEVHCHQDIHAILPEVDVLVLLRIQKERLNETQIQLSDRGYFHQFGLTPERLALLPNQAIVIHPGPINRGIEIDPQILSDSSIKINQQVTNGLAARMAILTELLIPHAPY